jgi:hypothetical protein
MSYKSALSPMIGNESLLIPKKGFNQKKNSKLDFPTRSTSCLSQLAN